MENIIWKHQKIKEYVLDLVKEKGRLLNSALEIKKILFGHILR